MLWLEYQHKQEGNNIFHKLPPNESVINNTCVCRKNKTKLLKLHVSGLTGRSPLPITMLPAITIQTTLPWHGTLSQIMFWLWPNATASRLWCCFLLLSVLPSWTKCGEDAVFAAGKTFSNISKVLDAADDKLGEYVSSSRKQWLYSEFQRTLIWVRLTQWKSTVDFTPNWLSCEENKHTNSHFSSRRKPLGLSI